MSRAHSLLAEQARPLAREGTGLALLVIATAQLMLVLDDSIANIALPSIQNDLGISAVNLPWVINAYILAFGGLLLFGGRLGDLFGRRRVLQLGMSIFTVASLVAAFASSGAVLIGARGLQGIGAALTAPNALALITTTFPEGKPRNNAIAVYGAMSGLGIVVGLLLGGVLTGLLGWRWVFLINVPIGLLVLLGSRTLVEADLHDGRLDVAGALTSIGGMVGLVYAVTRGGEHGWTDSVTVGSFAAAVVLLGTFVFIQARSANPLVPLVLFRDRSRAGSYLAMSLLAFGPMGAFYLLTLYMQHVIAFSPMRTGLSWLPFGVGIVLGAGITTKIAGRFTPRALASIGMLLCSAAMLWLSSVGQEPNYVGHLLPGIFFTAFGFAMGFVPLTLTAVHAVRAQEAGIASALLNASQQLGVAFGLSVLSTVAVTVTDRQLPNALNVLYRARVDGDQGIARSASSALLEGYGTALASGALVIALAALIAASVITAKPARRSDAAGAALH
jgi:EmrB/QacA subfamily drug resistance transporter